MTAGETIKPDSTTPGYGAYPAPIPSAPPQGFTQPPPAPPYSPPRDPYVQRPRRGRAVLAGLGIAAGVALSAAALTVSLVNTRTQPPAAAPPSTVAPSAAPAGSTAADDKALCEAIAPLMKEDAARSKAFVGLGHTGTPERDAGIPVYVADTAGWAKLAQDVIDQHTVVPPDFLLRSVQRYVDDVRSYAANIRPGPAADEDNAAWNDSLVAGGGAYEVCGDLGVPLW
jgi:hypothetical protein